MLWMVKPIAACKVFTFLFFLSLIFVACFRYTTEAYVCRLMRRWDPETALHRWAMPYDERCLCLGVVAPDERHAPRTCPVIRGEAHSGRGGYWFTDNMKNITRRSNWTPVILNELLERAEYCGKLSIRAGEKV